MSDSSSPGESGGSPETARIEAELAETREQLAQTVDALGAKLDVKGRASAKAAEVRDQRGTEIAVAAGTVAALVVVLVVWRRGRA